LQQGLWNDTTNQPQLFPSFHMWGQSFSPNQLTENIHFVFTEANEIGEIGVTGPYKGEVSRYGAAIIRPPKDTPPDERLYWMMTKIFPGHTRKFCQEHGITEAVLYLGVRYKHECCTIFSGSIMQSIGSLGVPVVITCVRDDESLN